MIKKVIIGTRGSELALAQATFIENKLQAAGLKTSLKIIRTKGDIEQNLSVDKMEGKGFFTKEIEEALLSKEIDVAVHSMKDLPTEPTRGLMVASVPERADPSEILIINKNAYDPLLPVPLKINSLVGTSSARRIVQLKALRPDLRITELRGNVPTRIKKLAGKFHGKSNVRQEPMDAILIAKAGVNRLLIDLTGFQTFACSPDEFIPAPGQGALALQVRRKDAALVRQLKRLSSGDAQQETLIERKIMAELGGGCTFPLGVHCIKKAEGAKGEKFRVRIAVAPTKEMPPRYYYFESKNGTKIISDAVKLIKKFRPFSVFITKDYSGDGLFFRILESNGCRVTGKALISFREIPVTKIPETDWIFFSSRHAVQYFFEQSPLIGNKVKFGVIGKSTANALLQYSRVPNFTGKSANTQQVAMDFVRIAGDETVLFPEPKTGLRTVQAAFADPGQVFNLPVYETIYFENPGLDSSAYDFLIFTSPSNGHAFFKSNKITGNIKIIAMGEATEKTLKNYGVKSAIRPVQFNDIGLLMALFSNA